MKYGNHFNVRVTDSQLEKLAYLARLEEEEGVTTSDIVRRAIVQYLRRNWRKIYETSEQEKP